MTEQQTEQAKKRPGRCNHLPGKVVLLIGDDTAVLPELVWQLAHRGADIALHSRQMPQETAIRIKESVRSAGQRLLLIDQAELQTASPDHIVETVTERLGSLDILIDLTAKIHGLTKTRNGQDRRTGHILLNWQINQAALRTIVFGNTSLFENEK